MFPALDFLAQVIDMGSTTVGRGSDVMHWIGLKNGAFPSYLVTADSSEDDLDQAARLLPCCLVLILISIYFIAFSRSRKEHVMRTRTTLRAFLTIVAPTCSLWPSRYIKLAGILRPHVGIPLEIVMEDVTNGVIELRNPMHDLADLIGSGTTINGHTIRINVRWTWWINYFEWWILVKSKSGGPSGRVKYNAPSTYPSPLGLLPSLSLDASTSSLSFCLDHFPNHTIPSLNAGCKATLEFTAFSSSLRALSTAQIISAIPFILSERIPRRPRTLVSVLKQLSASYDPNIVVDSISNISADHECALRYVYESVLGEQKIRDRWVRSLGIKTWRRDMFLIALEAALLRRGWIERWAVQVTAK